MSFNTEFLLDLLLGMEPALPDVPEGLFYPLEGLRRQGFIVYPALYEALDHLVVGLSRMFFQLIQALFHLGLDLDSGGRHIICYKIL